MIPCSLDCTYQKEGLCELKVATGACCADGRCPHYLKKREKSVVSHKESRHPPA